MRGSPTKWSPPLLPAIGAVVSGLLLAAAFPPFAIGPLAFVALVPVVFCLQRGSYSPRAYFNTGYLFGVAFFGGLLWWVVKLSPAASMTVPWLLAPATLVLVLYLAVYPGLFFLALRWIGRGRKLLAVLLAPALWVLAERVRGSGEFGFPWGSIGYALVHNPSLMQGASYAGVLGLGALILLVNMLVAASLGARGAAGKTLLLAAGIGLFAANHYAGKAAIEHFDSAKPSERRVIALVQPNVELAIKWNPEFADSIFGQIVRLTREAGSRGARLIVFPETAAPVYMRHSREASRRLSSLARELDAGIFIGFLDARRDAPDGALNVYNSSGVYLPDGTVAQYDKIHLLPFGEAIPFAWKFRFLGGINFGQANFLPGPDRFPLDTPVGKIAPLICFESTFSDLPRKAVLRGADLLVNITNDGWFGQTPGPYQHSDMAMLRAVENRRFLARSGNTGITLIVDPVGRVTRRFPMDREGILTGEFYPVAGRTFYTRHGDRPLTLLSLSIVIVALVSGFVLRAGRLRGVRNFLL
jgi:apolipoprotein N-acyltransferase